MTQMSQVLRERAIDMLNATMSTIAVAREFNVNFSTISPLQYCLREFGSTSNWPHNRRPCVWHCVGEWFSDVNVVNRVPHGGGGQALATDNEHNFINGNLNAQRYHDEILRPIIVPLIRRHHLMLQHDNTQPHVARICTEFLEAENVPVLP